MKDSFIRTKETLKQRELSREQAKAEYEAHLKNRKIPTFKIIQERYEKDKQDYKTNFTDKMLDTIHEKYLPNIVNDKMKDHIRQYNVHLNIQEVKRKEKTQKF